MSTPEGPDLPAESELDFEGVVGHALRPRELSAEALHRVRAGVEAEWHATNVGSERRRLARRRGTWTAILAAASLLAVGFAWWRPANNGSVVGRILRFDAGGIAVQVAPLHRRVLGVGDPIRVGDELEVGGATVVLLGRQGTLRVAGGTALVVGAADSVDLEHGRIYVDLPPGQPADRTFRVLTREGAIEHLGTIFEVLSDAGIVRLRVREGAIRWWLASGPAVATAGVQLSITPAAGLARSAVPTNGRDWAWAEALAPDYEIEGRSLLEFLDKVSRELGCRVEFADTHASEVAARTVLHGSVKAREPREALETVLATTSLSYEFQGTAIRVHSDP